MNIFRERERERERESEWERERMREREREREMLMLGWFTLFIIHTKHTVIQNIYITSTLSFYDRVSWDNVVRTNAWYFTMLLFSQARIILYPLLLRGKKLGIRLWWFKAIPFGILLNLMAGWVVPGNRNV